MKERREQLTARTGYDFKLPSEFEERAWPLEKKAAEALAEIFKGFDVKQLERSMHNVELMLKGRMKL